MYELNNLRDFLVELKPLIALRKFQAWKSIGSKLLSWNTLVTCIRLFGNNPLGVREVINTLYSHVVGSRHIGTQHALDMISALLNFASNPLLVDYYFAFLSVAHTFSVNRCEFGQAEQIESYL